MASEKIKDVTDATFDAEVLRAAQPVLVDFWAPWCGPCRSVGPMVDDLAAKYDGRVTVAKMNVDENPLTPSKYGVRGIPNLKVFKGGQVVDEIVGAVPKQKIEEMIEKAL